MTLRVRCPVHYALCPVLCALCSVPCALCPVPYALCIFLLIKINIPEISKLNSFLPVYFPVIAIAIPFTDPTQAEIAIRSKFISIMSEKRDAMYSIGIVLLSKFIIMILFLL